MRPISVADCETDPFKHGRIPEPFAWGYYDGTNYHEWWEDDAGFHAFMREQRVICFAHNGGKFDWHFVLPKLNPYDDVMIINGRIAKCFLGAAELRDSYNILPIPLKAYKKESIDYAIMEKEERNKPHNKAEILKYLKSDCIYLYELVAKFIALYGLQITQASAALHQWKKISKNKPPQSTKEFYDLFSPYYYGGRVECFQSGILEQDFSVYDINSAYPYAMQQEHPYSGDYIRINGYAPDSDFYHVRCVSKGAFPYRGEGNPGEFAGLRFPHDNEMRTYFVTGWEYKAAIETKTIREVNVVESIAFTDKVHFRDYIEHFYNMRLIAKRTGNEAESLFAKLLMNSLYGKFAANPENYRNYMIVPMDVIAGLGKLGWSFAGEMGPWALAEAPLTDEQKRYYNVATGASITGFVRAMLWRAICKSRGVMYCDTDSITVRSVNNIDLGEKLGHWKFEGTFDRAGIAGKKLYILRSIPIHGKFAEYKKAKADGDNVELDRRDGQKAVWRKFKTASKGARLTNAEHWEVAKGGMIEYKAMGPTFSAGRTPDCMKDEITCTWPKCECNVFIKRKIRYTAAKRRKGNGKS